MSIGIDVKRTKFFAELSENKQKEYFDLKCKKFLPCIDNIYYTCFLKNDRNENDKLVPLLTELEEKKRIVLVKHESIDFFNGLQLMGYGFNVYKYCLSDPELYDIFIIDYLPNDDTPRVLVQLRAYGLWVHGVEQMVKQSFVKVQSLFKDFVKEEDFEVDITHCRENRIDYCYHTNIIKNPYVQFSDSNLEKHMQTIFCTYGIVGHLEKSKDNENSCKLVKDYVSLGKRAANNVFVRIYNKGLEVCQLAYKSFFFEYWHQHGLINAFDKFCYEYAYEKKDYDYIHKARLLFYIEHGADAEVRNEFQKKIDADLSPLDYKRIADKLMPEVTTVINIEFETKRKFYYYSDQFIDNQLTAKTSCPDQIRRLFKIIDNRDLFLDYLTSKTLAFVDPTDGSYCDWWSRLRSVKLGTVKSDDKLLRSYSKELDKNIVLKRAVNAVATNALYNGLESYDLKADISDLMANINDNTIQGYRKNKAAKQKRLKNMLN